MKETLTHPSGTIVTCLVAIGVNGDYWAFWSLRGLVWRFPRPDEG